MRFNQAIPILRSFDEAKAREFYCDFLGFSVDWTHRFAQDLPLYMQISRSGSVIHLSEHHGDCAPGSALRIEVEDADQLRNELIAKTYRHARPGIETTPWNSREFQVEDPFHNRLIFYTSLPEAQHSEPQSSELKKVP